MPTVLRTSSYRFFFYAGDKNEPVHIHVEDGRKTAKFWLDPIFMEYNKGFRRHELQHVYRIIFENQLLLIKAWNEYFNA